MRIDGTRPMTFGDLLPHLGTIARSTIRPKSAKPSEAMFNLTTLANPKQNQAIDLLATIEVYSVTTRPLQPQPIET